MEIPQNKKFLQLKVYLFLSIFFTLFTFLAAAGNRVTPVDSLQKVPENIRLIQNNVKQKYAPDSRLSVFNIHSTIDDSLLILRGESSLKAANRELISTLEALHTFKVLNEIELLPLSTLGKDTCGIIRISVANLHRQPDITTEIINQTLLGAKVRLLKQEKGYYFCQLGDGYLGWIENSVLVTGDISLIKQWEQKELAIVSKLWGLVKKEQNHDSPTVTDVVACNEIAIKTPGQEWTLVELPDQRTGYVRTSLLIKMKNWNEMKKGKRTEIIKTTLQMGGFPYLWGGTSAKAMDCSGFIKTVFRLNRIQLPRDANMQVNAGTGVAIDSSFSKLEPCDLLFFSSDPENITHVGMYLGNYRFIHSEGLIHQASFNPKDDNFNAHRLRTLRSVRRIVEK